MVQGAKFRTKARVGQERKCAPRFFDLACRFERSNRVPGLAAVGERGRELAGSSPDRIFVVGAVGLEMAATLREEGMHSLIDPVADLLAWLRHPGSNTC